MKKIAFFDIDGTLTSEIDGSLPKSAINAIRHARTFGHLMFINTGRCFQNVEPRFRRIGFDGYVCGCGTNIFCSGTEALHVAQTHSITMQLLEAARKTNVDILFESRKEVAFDKSRSLTHPDAIHQSAILILPASTAAVPSANLFQSVTAKRPASSMCLTIIIWILTPPMRSATATTIFRCSLMYQTASPWEMLPRLPCLIRYLL